MNDRERWESVADDLLEGLLPHRSGMGALYSLPGPRPSDNGPRVDAFEGFSRSFLLAAFRMRHASESRRDELAARYAEGLSAGTAGPDAWPRIDGLTQPLVESAAIATGLLATEDIVWPLLDAAAQQRLIDYLLAARGAARPGGNWMWFQIMIETFLESLGVGADFDAIDERLEAILALRRSDGTWSDGGGARFDYYSSWAFNFYPAFWARVDGARRPDAVEALRRHAVDYIPTLRALIASDGSPVLQGRSLIYRAAAISGLWQPALMSAESDPDIARLATSVLDHFTALGVTDSGALSLGWGREFPPLAQPYSGPGSPYWMSKAFAGLLLPADHPVWTGTDVRAEPQMRRTVASAGWLFGRDDDIVRLHNHGTWRTDEERDPHSRRFLDDPFYSRLAYSSATAPVVDGTRAEGDAVPFTPDNSVELLDDRNDPAAVRTEIELLELDDSHAVSQWMPRSRHAAWSPIVSWTFSHGGEEVRIHRITVDRETRVRLTGYSLSGDAVEVEDDVISDAATVSCGGLVSSIRAVDAGTARVLPAPPGVFGQSAATPAIELVVEPGTHLAATTVRLDRSSAGPHPEVSLGRDSVTIRWSDGVVDDGDLGRAT